VSTTNRRAAAKRLPEEAPAPAPVNGTEPLHIDHTVVEEPAPPVGETPNRAANLFRELAGIFAMDYSYRHHTLSLTASENYPSLLVRLLGSGLHGGFYYYDPPYPAAPDEWYFPDSGGMAALAAKLRTLGLALFEGTTFDWRPNGGSAAEQAIMLGTCERGDALVHFAHRDGGHFALEELARKAGIDVFHLPMVDRTLLVDVDRLHQLVRDHTNIRLVILDQSFKLRWQPLLDIRAALPETVALSYDCSHDGALIAGGALPQPLLQGADIVHGNTHKTIAGPQKAFISFADDRHPRLTAVSNWLCPQLQSNCHAELIAPMIAAFAELAMYGREYAQQVTRNAKQLALALADEGFFVSGEHFGFTETHQVHVVLGASEKALHSVTELLPEASFRVNNVEIPGTNGMYGLRFGTQAMTRRGMREKDFVEVARLLARVILKREDPQRVGLEVEALMREFPVFPLHYSFDGLVNDPIGRELLEEVLR
jgi:glycine hydroxymethyltransferase